MDKRNWLYELEVDENHCLKNIIFTSEKMLEYLEKYGDNIFTDFILNTNRYGMPLMLFNVLTNKGLLKKYNYKYLLIKIYY